MRVAGPDNRRIFALTELAGWIAPIATMIAAMMTAANLGARVTGWGFVVFVVGSVCWSLVGVSSGQTNLLATNLFLTLVNAVGIWRWLGRQKAYEDGGRSAQEKSRRKSVPTLFSASGLAGRPVEADGRTVGKAVEALIECGTGVISYVVVSSGAVDETLRAVPLGEIDFGCDRLTLKLDIAAFHALPPLGAGDWPARASA